MQTNNPKPKKIEADNIKDAIFGVYKSLCCYGVNTECSEFLSHEVYDMVYKSTPEKVYEIVLDLWGSERARYDQFKGDKDAQDELTYNLGKSGLCFISLAFIANATKEERSLVGIGTPHKFAETVSSIGFDKLKDVFSDMFEMSSQAKEGNFIESRTKLISILRSKD